MNEVTEKGVYTQWIWYTLFMQDFNFIYLTAWYGLNILINFYRVRRIIALFLSLRLILSTAGSTILCKYTPSQRIQAILSPFVTSRMERIGCIAT